MKILRNQKRTMFGFKTRLYSVAKKYSNGKVSYYINWFWSPGPADFKIYESQGKSIIVNKFTLIPLSIFINVSLSMLVPMMFFKFYIIGAKNFLRDTSWNQRVRFFNWINFSIIIILLLSKIIRLMYAVLFI